jgi:hypothetical protein
MPTALINSVACFPSIAVPGRIERAASGSICHRITLPAAVEGIKEPIYGYYFASPPGEVGDYFHISWDGMPRNQILIGSISLISQDGKNYGFTTHNSTNPWPPVIDGTVFRFGKIVTIPLNLSAMKIEAIAAKGDAASVLVLGDLHSGLAADVAHIPIDLPYFYAKNQGTNYPDVLIDGIRASNKSLVDADFEIGILYHSITE